MFSGRDGKYGNGTGIQIGNSGLDVLPTDKETPFDQILRTSGLSISQLNEVLLRLEMKGLVRQWPGKVFTRKFV